MQPMVKAIANIIGEEVLVACVFTFIAPSFTPKFGKNIQFLTGTRPHTSDGASTSSGSLDPEANS